MASNKSVIVLTPNGRRQTVKVSPNTTILQILEEVCSKQGFKPEEYDIRHHNHVLDVSSIMRFSGLPNNALLEMCAASRIREETSVVLGIQLETGTRLTGNYSPGDNLWDILTKLCPEEVHSKENPVVIYMRQEVYGLEALQRTTLRSLGLTGGRAMLRLIHRKPEELRTQANVSAPLPSKPSEEKPFVRKLQKIEIPTPTEEFKNEPSKDQSSTSTKSPTTKSPPTSPSPSLPSKEKKNLLDMIKQEKSKKSIEVQKRKSSSAPRDGLREEPMEVDDSNSTGKGKSKIQFSDDVQTEDFAFLGERNALVFTLDMAKTVPHEELPDEFFELTVQDARKLLRDLKQKRIEIEENPLQTTAIRNLEKSKKVLRQLGQYKTSIIRVQFPDRTVLQGTFKPIETIETVMDFVREYLEEPSHNFYLYTTPPKEILDPTSTLLDAECVPSSVVYFGVNTSVKDDHKYLRKELFTKLTTHSMASIAAARQRGLEIRKPQESNVDDDFDFDTPLPENLRDFTNDDVNIGASTSTGTSRSPPITPARANSDNPVKKVPKWFRPSK